MTGVWQAVSAPADQAFQEVIVPPDFIAVGGGAEGTESPGTLVNVSNNGDPSNTFPRSWLAGVHANSPSGLPLYISPAISWGVGLKIEGVLRDTLRFIVQFPAVSSAPNLSTPVATLSFPVTEVMYPGSVCSIVQCTRTTTSNGTTSGFAPAVPIGGGIHAQTASSPFGQYATGTSPSLTTTCVDFVGCQTKFTGWTAASKDHMNPSPSFVTAQGTTLAKVLTINQTTFHVEVAVAQAQSGFTAHPGSSVSLPDGFALTGVGAMVNWFSAPNRTNPSGSAGNMLWRLKPRPDINGAEAASKDQWISSPATILTSAIGIRLVPGAN
jgi:hypothetical protein